MTCVCTIALKLLPFAITLALYFILFISSEETSVYAAVIKCLPILSLNIFVLLQGFNIRNDFWFIKRISLGLLFSCLGDLFLVWPDLFVPGMVAFAVAHIFYINAFGFKPLYPSIGVFLYTMATGMNFILMPGLKGVLVYGVPIYSYLLATMTWRTLARIPSSDHSNKHWNRKLTGIGGVLWLMSDAFLGFHHFHSPLSYSQFQRKEVYQ